MVLMRVRIFAVFPAHESLNLRQVLECGNGACDIAAFGLERELTEWISPMERIGAKAVNSLHSAPHSKTLARGTQVHLAQYTQNLEWGLPMIQKVRPQNSGGNSRETMESSFPWI